MAGNKQLLTGSVIGEIVLVAEGQEYVCTSLTYTMAMNNIPAATVTIGAGTPLSVSKAGSSYKSPEELLKKIQARRASGDTGQGKTNTGKTTYTDMIPCEIREIMRSPAKTTVIFKGVIAIGTVVYRAGTPTSRMIQFTCMNKVCELYKKPMSAYVAMPGSVVVERVTNKTPFSSKDALQSNTTFNCNTYSMEQLLRAIKSDMKTSTLLERCTAIVNISLVAGSYQSLLTYADQQNKGNADQISFKKYFTGDYKLTKKVAMSSDQFNLTILQYFLESLRGASIYEALRSVLVSEQYMLQLVPRWKNDFKMEICPSRAWDPSDSTQIHIDCISQVEASYSPIACINTPEAFVVMFGDAVGFNIPNVPDGPLGLNGVYSTKPELTEALKMRYGGKITTLTETAATALYKAKLYQAPYWLFPEVREVQNQQSRDPVKDAASASTEREAQKKKEAAESDRKTKAAEQIRAMADEIAKNLFVYLYGGEDIVNLRLYPSVRFNYTGLDLENKIGETIDVILDTEGGTAKKDSPLNLRGVLESITYNYTAGDAGSVNYTVRLSRVRPLSDSEKPVKCTLYEKA